MNTWKLLLSILIALEMVSCMSFAMTVDDIQKNESINRFNTKILTNRREKTSLGKYLPKGLDDDLNYNDNVDRDTDDIKYRNNRAIPASSSGEDASTRIIQQTLTSDLPNGKQKSNVIPQQKPRKLKNNTSVDGVCRSLDIRNNLRSFEALRNCRIIEGFLNIILISNITEGEARNLSFPELREITEYLLIYRVTNLTTLRYLFPNLEVIRGDTIFTDYAFMIYEVDQLKEIGLAKLMKISRGGVRIERNPSLCYAETVDWKSIVVAGEIFISSNQPRSNCSACSSCPDDHCWSENVCQKSMKSVCHSLCLGDCFGPTEKDCYVCKTIRHNNTCMEKCPENLYAFRERRCITASECSEMKPAHLRKYDEAKYWRVFNNSCVAECPIGYDEIIDQNNTTVCNTCVGEKCQKFENGAVVRHIADFQPFRGMSVIDGSLEFQIANAYPNIEKELIDGFGAIEEITGYLKIARSFPLSSLGFLKNLRVIRGRKLDINNASFVLLDNPNLSSLFHESQKIQIDNGRLFIHYNPKLCMSKITKLANMVKITNYTVLEIHPDSNGDKVACDIVNINITVKNKGSTYANIVWDVYEPSEGQNLINYMLSYIETENPNVTFEGNPCRSRKWQIVDVEIPLNSSPNTLISKLITDLKPYTSYGVYVKTLSVRNLNSFRSPTGQSKLILFRTDPDIPSIPVDVSTIITTESEINIQWDEPAQPNGPIAYYIVSGFIRIESEDFLSSRDYCKHGLVNEMIDENEGPAISFKAIIDDPESCCKKEVIKYKKFEILCYDNMTTGYIPQGKYNYCYGSHNTELNIEENLTSTQNVIYNKRTMINNGTYYSFVFNVSSSERSYVIEKLRYYSLYTIAVSACGSTLNNGTEMCSLPQYINARTQRRPVADNVDNVRAHVSNDTLVTITWDPVKYPNGLTVAYIIEYTNLIIKSATKTNLCISQSISRTKRNIYGIPNLSPGKYSARVRSMSLAGEGNWSQEVYFTVGMTEDDTVVAAIIVTISTIVLILIIVFLLFRSYRNKKKQERLIASVNPDYIESKYVRDSWEVSKDNIELSNELGLGNFGMVYRGILNDNTAVAVKTIPINYTEEEKNEFLNEASVMKNFSSFHLIQLLGVISEGDPYVIMELMENGDLKSYLRRIRDTEPALDILRIIRMAGEIADGMAYLESKKFVHRDLAARNCMVSKDLVCKIGDFGMARDIYETDYYKIGQKGLLPIRWMAPENLSDGVFTSDSDVWSFGVVLYEILTMGELPYQGFSNDEVLNHVLRKGTVTIPRNCPEIILKLMEKCFRWRPSERPTFIEIVSELESFLAQDFCEKSFYHSEEGIELRNSGLKKVYHNAAQIRFHWGNETARWVREFEDNVTLLDQTRSGTSRSKIFKNGFQHLGNIAAMEDIPLDRS